MKKSTIRRMLVLCLCLTLITVSLIGGTLAKYTTTVLGTDSITVAKFDFKAADAASNGTAYTTTSAATINIFDNVAEKVSGTVADNKVAPGCTGSFVVYLDNSTTEVDVDLSYTVTATANNVPIKFYVGTTAPTAESGYTIEATGLATALETAKGAMAIGETETINVYWAWVTTDDATDTTVGAAAATYTLNISITAAQEMTTDRTASTTN